MAFGCDLLLQLGVEVGEVEDAAQFLVAGTDEQRCGGSVRSACNSAARASRDDIRRERIRGLSASRSGRRKSLESDLQRTGKFWIEQIHAPSRNRKRSIAD